MIRLAAGLFLALAGTAWTPVAAQSISPADRTMIQQRITAFDTMMKEGRTGDSLDFVQPHLLDTIAKKASITAADVRASLTTQIAQAMKDVKILSFRMLLSAGTAASTPDKSRTYMLIPTETVLELPGGGRFLSKTQTLALEDRDIWYLMRIDDAKQVLLLRETYPEFEGVAFPVGSTTALPPS